MPDEQDQSQADEAPQHVLRTAIIPVQLDLTEAMKQIEMLEERLKTLSTQTDDAAIKQEQETPELNRNQSQQPANEPESKDLQALQVIAMMTTIRDTLLEIKQYIDERRD